MPHIYETDGAAIYRQSFAMIRAEADLAPFFADEEPVAVRMIHAAGRRWPLARRCCAMRGWCPKGSPVRGCLLIIRSSAP
jgi:hypothetical protein